MLIRFFIYGGIFRTFQLCIRLNGELVNRFCVNSLLFFRRFLRIFVPDRKKNEADIRYILFAVGQPVGTGGGCVSTSSSQ